MNRTLKNIGKLSLISLGKIIELVTNIEMNKRNRLVISTITILLLYLTFRGVANHAMAEIVILGSSVVYGLGLLRLTGTKDYASLFGIIGLLFVFSTFLVVNVYEYNPVTFTQSLEAGTFYGFIIGGASILFVLVYEFFTFEGKQHT